MVGEGRRKIQGGRPSTHRTPKSGGGGGNKGGGGCCPMAAALQSVKRGQFRLARRYAAMSVRLIAARIV